MKKFTVFTVILTIIIVVVASEILVDEYLPSLDTSEGEGLTFNLPESLDVSSSGQTNVLESDSGLNNRLGGSDSLINATGDITDSEILPSENSESLFNLDELGNLPTELQSDELPVIEGASSDFLSTTSAAPDSTNPTGLKDFEDASYTAMPANVYLRDEQIKSAGFVGGYIEKEANDGYLYKNIYLEDIQDIEVEKNLIRTEDEMLARVYILKAGLDNNINEVYQLLKIRASESLDVQVNETNEFGLASFFMNDSKRSNTAFLTVRIGTFIYGFSYPKDYHSQVKNLVQLLEWELQ